MYWQADPPPHLTPHGSCSVCDVKAISLADEYMKVCPQCYAMLWHSEEPTAEQIAEQAAQRSQMRAKRERRRQEQLQERKAFFLAGKKEGP